MIGSRAASLALLLFAVGCGGSSTPSVSSDRLASVEGLSGSTSSGGTLYSSSCAACHGARGAGGSAPSLLNADETRLIQTMISGKSSMPSYSTLSDQQLADVAAFVLTM